LSPTCVPALLLPHGREGHAGPHAKEFGA